MRDYDRLLRPRTAAIEMPAPFWRRALALVSDLLILDLIVTAPFTSLFAGMIARAESAGWLRMTYTDAELAAMVVVFLLAFAYFALFEYTLGQTPGMTLMRMRVRTPPRLWQAMVRNAFLIPIGPVLVLWIAEPIAIAFTHASLLERLSGTRTVHARQVII